jgi:hypothetical protein
MDNELLARLRPLADSYMKSRGGSVTNAIAAGGSAAVYVVQAPSHAYALKVYAPELLDGVNASAELRRIDIQRGLMGHSCPSLVQLHAVNVEQTGCYVEMDYFPWATLKNVLTQVPDAAIPTLLSQLVEAARFLDDRNVVHRDVKPENILVSPDFTELRLIDLGVVRESDAREDALGATDNGHRRPFVATAQYSSPEYLFRLQAPSADMWRALTFYQIGGVLHDLLIKRPLFAEAARTENKHVISMAVFRDTPDLSAVAPELAHLAALASHCLTKDPELRLRLVSWERFVSPTLSGSDRLRAMSAQARATAQARRELEQAQRVYQVEREQYVNQVHENVRLALQDLGGQAYKTSAFCSAGRAANFHLRLAGGAVLHLKIVFAWQGDLLPYRAAVSLLAALNADPEPQLCQEAAVGEADTKVSSTPLCEAVVDRIGYVVATVVDQMTTGLLAADANGRGDLVALAGLK